MPPQEGERCGSKKVGVPGKSGTAVVAYTINSLKRKIKKSRVAAGQRLSEPPCEESPPQGEQRATQVQPPLSALTFQGSEVN